MLLYSGVGLGLSVTSSTLPPEPCRKARPSATEPMRLMCLPVSRPAQG